jgi:hypothetical protein
VAILPLVNLGTGQNTGTGDSLLAAFTKINAFLTQTGVGGLLYPVLAGETGAVNLWYYYGNVLRYGTNTTPGTTDMTTALNNANTSVSALGGGTVVIPGGTFTVSGIVTVSANVWFQGSGDGTIITTSSATSDVFQLTGNGARVSDMSITASVTRTGGYYVNFNGIMSYVRCERVDMFNFYNGIGHTGNGGCGDIRITDCYLTTNTGGGFGINFSTTINSVDIVLDKILIGATSAVAQMAAGVQVVNAGDISLRNVGTVYCGNGLRLIPGNGQTVQVLLCTDCLFDSGNATNVAINPLGTGSVQLAKFLNTWACSSTAGSGFSVCASSQGTVLRSEFLQCVGSNNSAEGLIINYSGATDTSVIGGMYAGNTHGLYVASGVTKFKFMGNICRASGQFAANTSYGLVMIGLNDQFTVSDNDFNNAGGTGNANITAPVGGTAGQTWFIKDNQGVVTKSGGQAVLTAAGTTTAVTHGLAGTPRLQDIYLTQNSSLGTAAQAWVSAVGSTTFTITTNANPGAGVNMGWNASLWGA